ncbi:hypothetical protein Cgig2_033073 [Carnegiea gigantea]|uniref:Uncharacterized protein n=1 Tax=Carnegiea gigantea TaxID=171969 RepID=A0A9Q1GKY1_9CARY|nr:hypothetical protein Cgig2_033073 [Carnegiea gigantea]
MRCVLEEATAKAKAARLYGKLRREGSVLPIALGVVWLPRSSKEGSSKTGSSYVEESRQATPTSEESTRSPSYMDISNEMILTPRNAPHIFTVTHEEAVMTILTLEAVAPSILFFYYLLFFSSPIRNEVTELGMCRDTRWLSHLFGPASRTGLIPSAYPLAIVVLSPVEHSSSRLLSAQIMMAGALAVHTSEEDYEYAGSFAGVAQECVVPKDLPSFRA